MYFKTLTATLFLVMLTAGCSTLQKVVYRPDINQGNYLTATDVAKLQQGMSKQQVLYLLGTPMMQDPFGSNTWLYVFRQQPGHQDVKQQTLTLQFDGSDQLISIKNDNPQAMATPSTQPEEKSAPAAQNEEQSAEPSSPADSNNSELSLPDEETVTP